MFFFWGFYNCIALYFEVIIEDSKLGDNIKEVYFIVI